MVRYRHGSEDSVDIDMYYVFDEIPDICECKDFCHHSTENRNIITIKNGIVADTYIGVVDEVNNGLLVTYPLHMQEYPLLVTEKMERDIPIKQIRAIRGILSILSRTPYREDIKYALRTNWTSRLECAKNIDLTNIDLTRLNKNMDIKHILKVIAFQIGQGMGLLKGIELYTKSAVAKQYPLLKKFLYRESANIYDLDLMLQKYVYELEHLVVEETGNDIVYFPKFNKRYELRHETKI